MTWIMSRQNLVRARRAAGIPPEPVSDDELRQRAQGGRYRGAYRRLMIRLKGFLKQHKAAAVGSKLGSGARSLV
jgi:hypothetical protein